MAPAAAVQAPVDGSEPVAGVEAVAVHALGAQDVLTGVEERNALAQRDQAEADLLHAYTLGKRGAARRLELDHVEQGLVVVRGGVVDRFLRVGGIPGTLAEVIDLIGAYAGTAGIDERAVGTGAGQSDANPLADMQQD